MIKLENLHKSYEGNQVLSLPSLQISRGQSLGLVGNNGAGKTTLFSLILDLIKPTKGHVYINDVAVNKSEDWKSITAAFLDENFLIGYLTPEEYFGFVADLRKVNPEALQVFLGQFQEFFNGEILSKKKYIRDLSKGNQKKVGIVGALIGQPSLVILDEPFANLDPTTQILLKKILKNLASQQGTTVLISSHDLQHVTEVCERIVVLEKGEIVQDKATTPQTLKELEDFFTKLIREENAN